MISELELKKEICEIGKRLYAKGLLSSTDGSISIKLRDNEYLCTATGTNKGFMTMESICKVDGEGNVIKANTGVRVSSAVTTHLLIHKERPEMHAVIHAYPINATVYANAGIALSQAASLEAINCIGCVPYVEKGLAKTKEELQKLTETVHHFDAVLFGDIGVLTFGVDLESAFNKLESVELYASVVVKTQEAGISTKLTEQQEIAMFCKREKYGFTQKHPQNVCIRNAIGKLGCYSCSNLVDTKDDQKDIIIEISKKVLAQLNL
jgi:L-fuculose-phosphate aldolase